jgi:hypothetical protein
MVRNDLFGDVKGAFTGAQGSRRRAFRGAHGGTLFIDQIGKLPLSLPPQLLRALESREVVPVSTATVFGKVTGNGASLTGTTSSGVSVGDARAASQTDRGQVVAAQQQVEGLNGMIARNGSGVLAGRGRDVANMIDADSRGYTNLTLNHRDYAMSWAHMQTTCNGQTAASTSAPRQKPASTSPHWARSAHRSKPLPHAPDRKCTHRLKPPRTVLPLRKRRSIQRLPPGRMLGHFSTAQVVKNEAKRKSHVRFAS